MQNFQIKNGVIIIFIFRRNEVSHIQWKNELLGPSMIWHEKAYSGGGKDIPEVTNLLKTDEDCQNFMTLIGLMHNLESKRIKVAGDNPQNPDKTIAFQFVAKK